MIGAPRPLPLAKPAAIDTAQAARYFGARGEPDEKTMALLETCALPLLAAATPRAVWLEADTAALAEAGILRGGDVMRHLEGCPQAVLLAVTLGPGVDAQIRRAGVGDIAAGVASDALGSALAEQAADAAEAELRQWAAKEGKYLTGRFSPGYGDWDIAVQPLVANALDTVRRTLGTTLSAVGDGFFEGGVFPCWALCCICLLLAGHTLPAILLTALLAVALLAFRTGTFFFALRYGLAALAWLKDVAKGAAEIVVPTPPDAPEPQPPETGVEFAPGCHDRFF